MRTLPAIRIQLPPDDVLRDFCLRHRIARLSLFGSATREDFGPNSDVDILVEFLPDTRIGLMGMVRLEDELTALIGRKADLRTPRELSPYFAEGVLQEAVALYVAA